MKMSMIKRIFALLLTVAMLVCAFASCDKQKDSDQTNTPTDTTAPEEVSIPIPPTTPPKKITSVHITCGKTPAENFAAAELRWYFIKKNVSLSDNGFGVEVKIDNRIAKDGYKIFGYENSVVIMGGNERGLVYGLYGFLEKFLGVHFYSADTTIIDEGDVMIGGGVLAQVTPAFEVIRNPWYPLDKLAEKDGGNTKIDADLCKTLTTGTVTSHLGLEQPCLTNAKNQTRAIAYVEDFLSKNPHVKLLTFTPDYGEDNYCRCESCTAVDSQEGSPAGTYVRFINKIVNAVSPKYPDLKFEITVRDYLQKAPSVTKPTSGISVRFSAANCHISHPINDSTCPDAVAFADGLESWGAICDNVCVEYGLTATKDFIPTFANLGTLRENLKFFAESGVSSITCGGNIVCPSGEFGELRVYLVSQLLQNPLMSEEEYYAYMDSFLKAFYGEGWEYIRKFIDKTIELSADGHQTANGSPFDAITQEEYLANEGTFDEWWNKAEELAGERIDFVKRARYQWRYIKLCLHPNAEEAQKLINDAASNPRVGWREKQWNVDVANSDLSKAPGEWKYKS